MAETFVVEQKSLLSILSSMQPICSKRTTVEATGYILFNCGHRELILKSTDLEISLQSSYLLSESFLTEPKSFLVNGKRLFDVVKELDGDITFLLENNQLLLKSSGINLSLNIKDAQEFPQFPERIENLMQFDSAFLSTLLEKVSFLIPQNNSNPALNGLFLELDSNSLKMTTTDGHCLAQIQTDRYKLEKTYSWLLPKRAILELKKILETSQEKNIFLGTCSNQLVFSGETFNFFTKLLSATFPEYKSVLNKEGFICASVDRVSLLKTLRRSVCLLSGQFIATNFEFNNDKVDVSIKNKEVGNLDEQISIKDFSIENLSIKFYAPYLLNGLNAFSCSEIKFFLHNSTRPILFESIESNNEYFMTYLVMPIAQNAS